jgi:hypothetical protein
MEHWRHVWRAAAGLISTAGLEALAGALASDDPALLQGQTCEPPPLACVQDWRVSAACALAYCGWAGDGLEKVEEVERYFARTCSAIDNALGEVAGCRWFLNWWDETPRAEARHALLSEVEKELGDRGARGAGRVA